MNQNAPSVDYPVGRFSLSVRLAFALALASIVLIVGALWRGYFLDGQWKLLLPLWAMCCWFSFSTLKRGQPKCWLSWDGSTWQILPVRSPSNLRPSNTSSADLKNHQEAQEAVGHLTVHLDLQRVLLVSLANPEGDRNWFWVSQAAFPERWHGFRCAVYSRAE